jgi:hypothetical protein
MLRGLFVQNLALIEDVRVDGGGGTVTVPGGGPA